MYALAAPVFQVVFIVARWIVTVPAGLMFGLIAWGSWTSLVSGLIQAVRGQETRFSLCIPLAGLCFGFVFFLAIPVDGFARVCWLALVIEPTWLLLVWGLLTLPFAGRAKR